MKHKIAITGGAGFIGRSLVRHFAEKFQVKILDVKPLPGDLKGFATHVPCDVRDYHEVVQGLGHVDLVMHAAIVQIPLINENKSLGYEVNIIGTQNVCRAVKKNPKIKGMILAGTWHTVGERDLKGIIDEEFGFRPDKVEGRARLYALSKIGQEAVVRYYDEMSTRIYGVIRMGTVLGGGMPPETAASIFIKRGLRGEPITPFRHSMHRPMLYVDVRDICRAYEIYASKILNGECEKDENSLAHIFNVYYPEPVTILDLAGIVRKLIIDLTEGKVRPKVEVLDKGIPPLFRQDAKNKMRVSIEKAKKFLELGKLRSPEEALTAIIKLAAHARQ